MIAFDSRSTTLHTLKAVSFVLSSDQPLADANLAICGLEMGHLMRACQEAIWWQAWEFAFREIIAGDKTLTAKQVAEARIVLDVR